MKKKDTTVHKKQIHIKNIKNPSGAGLKKTFKSIVAHTKKHLSNLKPKCKKMLMQLAYETAQEMASDIPIKLPRVIPVPKTGGFLPLIPIFAGLSATGGIVGGIAGIKKAISEYNSAKKHIAEFKRRNQQIEALCIGKGLHLKPHRGGLGIFIAREKKN